MATTVRLSELTTRELRALHGGIRALGKQATTAQKEVQWTVEAQHGRAIKPSSTSKAKKK